LSIPKDFVQLKDKKEKKKIKGIGRRMKKIDQYAISQDWNKKKEEIKII